MAMWPFLFASGIPFIQKLALDSELTWPKYEHLELIAIVLRITGHILGKASFTLFVQKDSSFGPT